VARSTLNRIISALLLLGTISLCRAQEPPAAAARENVECDRQMRKILEALQAWRRLHQGRYPESLVELAKNGLIPPQSLRCPVCLKESPNASSEHPLSRSQRENHDPTGYYEYELSSVIDPVPAGYMRDAPTRREIKTELLRREGREEVPLLRCSVHRDAKPIAAPARTVFRNLTSLGFAYWSGEFWESEWKTISPLCRQALVVRGLRGPPFHSGIISSDPNQLDLRACYNACGEKPWWWGVELIDAGSQKIDAPDLSELLAKGVARTHVIGGVSYWLDGVVQLQGRLERTEYSTTAYTREVFPWRTPEIPVGRNLRAAHLLVGSVWSDREGHPVGRLIWKIADEPARSTALVYGKDLRRFWRTKNEIAAAPKPVFESTNPAGPPIQLYSVVCENPFPGSNVVSLQLESEPASPAAPFVLAITLQP
jgi:hypothetical protein